MQSLNPERHEMRSVKNVSIHGAGTERRTLQREKERTTSWAFLLSCREYPVPKAVHYRLTAHCRPTVHHLPPFHRPLTVYRRPMLHRRLTVHRQLMFRYLLPVQRLPTLHRPLPTPLLLEIHCLLQIHRLLILQHLLLIHRLQPHVAVVVKEQSGK
jgi:hypothetical protein